jgi:integrase
MGLGSRETVTLAEAREAALAARKLLQQGADPLEAKRQHVVEQRLASAKALTFREAAAQYIASHESAWRSGKHKTEWVSTLERFVFPQIGSMSVQSINVELVLGVLRPNWERKTKTMSNVRGRIEMILDFCKARGLYEGDNPASWRTLKHLLPARAKVQRKQHHPAMDYAEVGAFVAELRKLDGVDARALEFTILTAVRSGEAINATWAEINDDAWVIPAERTKTHKQHRVPLSPRAAAILEEMKTLNVGCPYIFPGRSGRKQLGGSALIHLLNRLRPGLTVHGCRSSFRDWCGAMTSFPREVAEMCLGHRTGDAVEQAYARTDYYEKRRRLMAAWAKYIDTPSAAGTIVELRHRT